MKKLKLLGFLFAVISMFILGGNSTDVFAEEPDVAEVQFDITNNQPQEATYIKKDGQEVIISIEPVESKAVGDNLIAPMGHAFPYGTTTYTLKATTGYASMWFDVNVYVPSNINDSKFIWAGNPQFASPFGYINDKKTTFTNKEAKYTGDFIWLGVGGSSAWMKGTLNQNIVTVSASM